MVRSLVLPLLLGLLVLASRAAAQTSDHPLKASGTENYQIIIPNSNADEDEDVDDDTRDRDADGDDENANTDDPATTGGGGGGGGAPCGAGMITFLPLLLTLAAARQVLPCVSRTDSPAWSRVSAIRRQSSENARRAARN